MYNLDMLGKTLNIQVEEEIEMQREREREELRWGEESTKSNFQEK